MIFEEKQNENAFNNFFVNIDPKVPDDTPMVTRSFENWKTNETIKNEALTINELKDTSLSSK